MTGQRDRKLAQALRIRRPGLTAEEWNARYPVGTKVRLRSHLDDTHTTEHFTRSEAWNLCHGEPVVLLSGKTGGWALSNLTPEEA